MTKENPMAQSSFLPFTSENLILVNRIYFCRPNPSISLAVEEPSGEYKYLDVCVLRSSHAADWQRSVPDRPHALRFIAEVFAAMQDMDFDDLDWAMVPLWVQEMMDEQEIHKQPLALSDNLQLPAHIIEILKVFQHITGMVFHAQTPNGPGGDILFIGESPPPKTPTD